MRTNVFLVTDAYKLRHHMMYPKDTIVVYSNFTPRSEKYANVKLGYVISFGQQMVMRQIHEMFNETFFKRVKSEVISEIKKEYELYLGDEYDMTHIEELWELGHLPIEVKTIPEGMKVPIGVPVLTIKNTDRRFYWLTNFLETLISTLLWKPITSATTAHAYRQILDKAIMKTDKSAADFVDYQGHDFSMRGMDSIDAVISSSLGHVTSFMGSDSLPVIHGARKYYDEEGYVAGSVTATEHSVMSAGGAEEGDELNTFRYLMKQFPKGILSIVSDTWNLWDVLTKHLPALKEEILQRDGKIVIRPDSGNPVDIICGYEGKPFITFIDKEDQKYYMDNKAHTKGNMSNAQYKGVIELLWDLFGGTINDQGYKVLDPHIGAIYGDSITLDRAKQIVDRLAEKGFASSNVVLGIGSYTYQFNTRDTYGFAMKATYVELRKNKMDAVTIRRDIFKDPITDDGTKKSLKGLLVVKMDEDGILSVKDQVTWKEEKGGMLRTIFKDGLFYNKITLTEIREKLKK